MKIFELTRLRGNVQQEEGRIRNKILGVKGLRAVIPSIKSEPRKSVCISSDSTHNRFYYYY